MSEPLKLKQWVNNIKLQNKLVIIYVVTGLLPLIILFVFAYGQMRSILMDRDVRSMESALRQSVTTVDGQIEVYDNLSNYITFNETVSGILSYNYSNKYEMYSQIVTTFDPLVSSLKYFHNDINKVTIYINNGIKHDTTLAPLSEIENEAFYNSAVNSTNINWYVDKDKKELISARKMSTLGTAGITGIMYINVDYDSIMDIYAKGLIDNSGIIVTDGNGSIISKKAAFLDNADKYILSDSRFTEFIEKADFSENVCSNIAGYVLIKQNSDVTGWTSYVYAPKSLMLKSTNSIITMIVLALVVACIGMAAATIFTSDFITKRIYKLRTSMEKVENGDFDVVIRSSDKDEIGALIHGFNSMTGTINNLINEVYEGKLSQKESEMRALRAQINPHFLYNSLSLINWKAIEYGQDDISSITLALSNYYRTSLNKGKNTLTVKQELSNMESYLNIQQIMHDNSFDVVMDIDENVLEYESLNLILQPLVENAIEHGIDLLTDRRGVITVVAKLHNGLIHIEVKDNGIGMPKETAHTFLTSESGGYGARNVNDRIRLFYGEQYNLKVSSDENGTVITIEFPARKPV